MRISAAPLTAKRHAVFLAACLLLCLFAGAISGCGYRFAGSAENRIRPDDTVWVSFIKNETASTIAQTALRRAVLDELHAMRGVVPTGTKEEADIQISGMLTGYTALAVSYSSIDQVKEYRIRISVLFEAKRKGADKPFWKGTVQATQDYPIFTDLALQSYASDAALVAASKKLAEKLVIAIESAY